MQDIITLEGIGIVRLPLLPGAFPWFLILDPLILKNPSYI